MSRFLEASVSEADITRGPLSPRNRCPNKRPAPSVDGNQSLAMLAQTDICRVASTKPMPGGTLCRSGVSVCVCLATMARYRKAISDYDNRRIGRHLVDRIIEDHSPFLNPGVRGKGEHPNAYHQGRKRVAPG